MAIGLLPEHKVLEIEKLNLKDDDLNNKSYEIVKKKEKPLHSVSHEGSLGKDYSQLTFSILEYYFSNNVFIFECYFRFYNRET